MIPAGNCLMRILTVFALVAVLGVCAAYGPEVQHGLDRNTSEKT
jgi:hypothetical protein